MKKRVALLGLALILIASCAPPATTSPPATATPAPTVTGAAASAIPATADVREPSVAGQFYPADADTLRAMVDGFLAQVKEKAEGEPIALMVPHAGYIYSGQVAAYAFKQIEGVRYDTVVVIGVNHSDPTFNGLSVWAKGAFRTPLGLVPVDETVAKALMDADRRIVFAREVHSQEHSIEVQLPFLQRVCPDCQIVPVIVGAPTVENEEALSDALARVLQGKKALIIASSDMSHYPPYDDARRVDGETLSAITSLDPERIRATTSKQMAENVPNLGTCLCGEGPVLAAMIAAKRLGANQVTVLKYANSGDVPFGDRDQVVGYGAVMLWHGQGTGTNFTLTPVPTPPPSKPLDDGEKKTLLALARDTLTQFLRSNTVPPFSTTDPGLLQERGAFVTLKEKGELRGCIGEMISHKPLYLTIQATSVKAALADPRFPPVKAEELSEITLEISVLGPMEPISDVSQIQVGTHGLVIVKGQNQGVFLPQVPVEQGWDRNRYLEELCGKAGLPEGCWRENAQLYAFTAEVFGEE